MQFWKKTDVGLSKESFYMCSDDKDLGILKQDKK